MHASAYQEFAEPRSTQTRDVAASDFRGADACEAALVFFRDYARERPEVVAMWAFGIGFVLAWKIKPW